MKNKVEMRNPYDSTKIPEKWGGKWRQNLLMELGNGAAPLPSLMMGNVVVAEVGSKNQWQRPSLTGGNCFGPRLVVQQER